MGGVKAGSLKVADTKSSLSDVLSDADLPRILVLLLKV